MLAEFSIARCFCFAGGGLAAVSLLLWVLLPIRMTLPPYFFTPLLALVYGVWSWRRTRTRPRAGGKEARE